MKIVLVAVLKSKDDLRLLLEEKWYRIPVAFLPRRKFTHIAFYQPLSFKRSGKRIEYYARVTRREVRKRVALLPTEPSHPRSEHGYLKCSFSKIRKLEKPIRNIIPRRVSFGFTDLKTLRSACDILELYHVAPTEQMVERELKRLAIFPSPQYRLSAGSKRYCLDLAIFCNRGKLAIECDNRKAHSSKLQKLKDRQKDAALKRLGWRVIRLTEEDISDNLGSSISRIKKLVSSLGGALK